MPSRTTRRSKQSPGFERVTPGEIEGWKRLAGVLAVMNTEKGAIRFMLQTPFYRGFFNALGLELNPNAKKLEDLIKPSTLLSAWSKVYEAIAGNQKVFRALVNGIHNTSVKKLVLGYLSKHSSPLRIRNQTGGARSVLNFLFAVFLMITLLYSSLGAHKTYVRGVETTPDVALGERLGAGAFKLVAGAVKGLAVQLPGAETIAGFFASEPSNLPAVVKELVTAGPNEHTGRLQGKIKNANEQHRKLAADSASLVKYLQHHADIKISLTVPDGQGGLKRVIFTPFQGIAARPQQIVERLTALTGLREELNEKLADAEIEEQHAVDILARVKGGQTLGRLASIVFTPTTSQNVEEHEGLVLSAKKVREELLERNARLVEEQTRLQAFQQQAAEYPYSLPYLDLLEPAGLSIHDAVRGDITKLTLAVANLDTSERNYETDAVKGIQKDIQIIVEKIKVLPDVLALAKPVHDAIISYVKDTLTYGLYEKLTTNVMALRADLRSQMDAIAAATDLFSGGRLIDACDAEAKKRNIEITEDQWKLVSTMLDDFSRYNLQPISLERMATVMIDLFSTNKQVKMIPKEDVANILERIHVSDTDRLYNAISQFLLSFLVSGVPATIIYAYLLKLLNAAPGSGRALTNANIDRAVNARVRAIQNVNTVPRIQDQQNQQMMLLLQALVVNQIQRPQQGQAAPAGLIAAFQPAGLALGNAAPTLPLLREGGGRSMSRKTRRNRNKSRRA